jgi:predicted transposase YdaD
MEQSVTYQAILNRGKAEGEAKGKAEGKAEEARKILLLLGREQLGEPSANQQAALDAITDTDQLNDLIVRLRRAASWQELLGSRRRLPRRKANT